jgi:hypothetical protein
VIDAVGGNTEGKGTYGGNRRLASCAVCHHAWHRLDVGPPAAVIFLSNDNQNGF